MAGSGDGSLRAALWCLLVDPFVKPDAYAIALGGVAAAGMTFASVKFQGMQGGGELELTDYVIPAAMFFFLYLHNYKRKYPPAEPVVTGPAAASGTPEQMAEGPPAAPKAFKPLAGYFTGVTCVRGGRAGLDAMLAWGGLEALVVLTLSHDCGSALVAFNSIASRHGSPALGFVGACAAGPAACGIIANEFAGPLGVALVSDATALVAANPGGKGVAVLRVVGGKAGTVWHGHIGALERFLSDNFGDPNSDSESDGDGSGGGGGLVTNKSG